MSDLKQFAKDNHVPIIQDGGLDFLLKTIKKINAKDILELGSYWIQCDINGQII